MSDDALEHTAGTGDGILLLAALSDDAQDHFADLLLVAAAGLGDLGEGSGVDVQGSDIADDLVGIDLAHVVVDLPSSLGQNALGLDNAVGTVLVAFQFSHFSFLLNLFIILSFDSFQRTLNGCVGWMGEKIFCLSKRVVCRNTLCISKKHTGRQAENFPFSRRQHFVQWLLHYFRGFRLRISRASAGVAISRPSSLAIRTTLATSSPLDAAFWPLPR